MPTPAPRSHRPAGAGTLAAGGALLAALTVGAWYAWLGRDHEYQTDPVTGVSSGPYEAWQVVGCVLSLLALAVAAGLLLHPALPVAVMPPAFTVAWSVDAANGDDTGLWIVGAVMLMVGLGVGTGIVTALTALLRRPRPARPQGVRPA